MNELQKTIIQSVANTSENDCYFIDNIKMTFPVKTLCSVLNIDRNRYNYLVRSKKLDVRILKLRNEVK